LLLILNKYLSSVGVNLSETEKINLCTSVEKVSDLLEKASVICSEKLALLEAQTVSKNSYWSFFSDTFNALGAFAYNHKGLVVCVGALVSGVAIYSLLQNLGFQILTLSSFREVAASSSNLDERVNNLTRIAQLNTDSISRLKEVVNQNSEELKAAVFEMKGFIRDVLISCADKEGTSRALAELSLTLSTSNIEVEAQRFALKIALSALLRNGLIEPDSIKMIEEFCLFTK